MSTSVSANTAPPQSTPAHNGIAIDLHATSSNGTSASITVALSANFGSITVTGRFIISVAPPFVVRTWRDVQVQTNDR